MHSANHKKTPIEKNDFDVSCTITKEGNPPVVTAYEWYHNGSKVPGKGLNLTLTDLHRYDSSGIYQCAANNKVGLGHPGKELDIKVWCKFIYHTSNVHLSVFCVQQLQYFITIVTGLTLLNIFCILN